MGLKTSGSHELPQCIIIIIIILFEERLQDVLGTVDQLLIDNCIMEEVRIHKRNLAVAYYDYRKAYDMVHHDWMLRVYEWMGIPKSVCKVIE